MLKLDAAGIVGRWPRFDIDPHTATLPCAFPFTSFPFGSSDRVFKWLYVAHIYISKNTASKHTHTHTARNIGVVPDQQLWTVLLSIKSHSLHNLKQMWTLSTNIFSIPFHVCKDCCFVICYFWTLFFTFGKAENIFGSNNKLKPFFYFSLSVRPINRWASSQLLCWEFFIRLSSYSKTACFRDER